MNGFILSYKDYLTRKDITLISYYLFGRIVSRINRNKEIQKYYYPGLFENTQYIKITNGCYFIEKIIDNYEGRLIIIPVNNIQFPKEMQFKTARTHWQKHITENKLIVKNFETEEKK